MEQFVRFTAPTGKIDFLVKLVIFVFISGFFNHLRDVVTAGNEGSHSFIHNAADASWTALPMCSFALILIGHLNTLQRKLYQQATTDVLTQLPNRRSFLSKLACLKGGRHVLVMLDVDHFKDVNDAYGHDVGDQCLRQIGRHLRRHLRPGDFCARLGGEEFAILLRAPADVDLHGVVTALVCGIPIEPMRGPATRITLSAGVAYFSEWRSVTDSLRAADVALYRAKENGRARYEKAADVGLPVLAEDVAADEPLSQQLAF